jgi:hypothetical protein
MAIIPIGRREVQVRGDGNCFYRAMARALDGETDRSHSKVRSLCNDMIERIPKYLKPLLFRLLYFTRIKVIGQSNAKNHASLSNNLVPRVFALSLLERNTWERGWLSNCGRCVLAFKLPLFRW